MRYQLTPENPSENAALKQNSAARPLFDPFLPVIQARSIMAAVRLGIFEEIGENKIDCETLSQRLSLDPDTMCLLVRVLDCAGYVVSDEGIVQLTDLARLTLLKKSPMPLTSWVEYNYTHWKMITHLEEVLQSGSGVYSHQQIRGSEQWAVYQKAMLETARPAAGWVASQIPVKEGAQKMLDIGGSHGLYGAAICREHSPMRSIVLDLPDAIDSAKALAAQEGISGVVSHRAGDVLEEDLSPEKYDVIFMGNIIHHFKEQDIRLLFSRIQKALTDEGTVGIWDFRMPENDQEPDLVSDGLALLFRLSSETRCYTRSEIIMWLASAGFENIQVHPTPMPTQLLITSRKV